MAIAPLSACMTRLFLLLGLVFLVSPATLRGQDTKLTLEEAKKLKNPVPYSRKSIKQGHGVFMRYCTSCHGNDGKATVDVVADASDLTAPKTWKNGFSEGEIFRSIRDGQGASMPSFKSQIAQEEDIWHLVNFIMSLWPEDMRPPLHEDK
jgi:mono/diheme cytochrome c family protein